jgi:hypothetical protein
MDGENSNYDSDDINDINKPLFGMVSRLRTGRCWVRVPIGVTNFSFPQNVQTGSMDYSVCTVVLSRQPGREIGHSPPVRTKI